jgi:flagellar biosynthesis GTPase FlhF
MNKNSLLTLGIGFIAGVGLTWSYFNLSSSDATPAKSQHADTKQQASFVQPVKSSEATAKRVVPAAPEQSARIEQKDNPSKPDPQPLDELPLEEQVSQLKQQLAAQKALMKNAAQQLRDPSDAQAVLQAQFDEQIRNEEWAYQTEIALQDFLLTSDLSSIPEIVSAACKTTVCKFELAAPTDNDSFDHTQWRELNDKLMKQEFWLQFKRTTSTSSDTELTLLMATEL